MHAMRKNATYIERVSGMLEVLFHESVEDGKLKYAVIVSRAEGRWVFCQHKARDTFECPGGRREAGETMEETARRELYEETGALDYTLKPLCVYSVTRRSEQATEGADWTGELAAEANLDADKNIGFETGAHDARRSADQQISKEQSAKEQDRRTQSDSASYGMLYYAEIQRFGPLPSDSEIGQIHLVTELPEQWTYPLIQPFLLEKVRTTVLN